MKELAIAINILIATFKNSYLASAYTYDKLKLNPNERIDK